jgi:uroporphyrinogen-III decarboxylase
MRPEQWTLFKAAAKGQPVPEIPLSLIIDSPWLPGYAGIGHLDYYLDPEVWFQANLGFAREFPEVIAFPSWWIEYGMAIEPSAMGSRIHFSPDQPPGLNPSLFRLEDLDRLAPVDPHADGFMALALHRYRTQKQRIFDAGFTITFATSRGPLCTAGLLRGLNDFLLDLSDNPEGVHRLLGFITDATIGWLKAQVEVIGPCVEGIFILDDVAGFLSRRAYLEFAHPYLRRICDAFPADWVKVYHNDANVRPFLADLPDTGFDVLNWSYKTGIAEAVEKTGGRLCLMGNVDPLGVGVRGTPDDVKSAVAGVIQKTGGRGLILSLGGGVSPGMTRENVAAMIDSVREYNSNACVKS